MEDTSEVGIVADEELAMGLKKIKPTDEQKKQADVQVTQEPETTKTVEGEATVKSLFGKGEIEKLLDKKEDPDAQLAAIVLMSNKFRHFNVRIQGCNRWLDEANLSVVGKTLGLDQEDVEDILKKREAYSVKFKDYKRASDRVSEVGRRADSSWGDERKRLQEERRSHLDEESRVESEMQDLYSDIMLPIRQALIDGDSIPEDYRLHAIEGIKGHGKVSERERELLRTTYQTSDSERVKNQIVDTVMYNVGTDIESFDIVPIQDLSERDVDLDKIFIATVGNKDTTREVVEQKISPAFFPDEDPVKVGKSWEALKKVTALENQPDSSFGSDGLNHHTEVMNIQYFQEFVDNSDLLIPTVEALEPYGFRYVPGKVIPKKPFPEYVDRLMELGESIDELTGELATIRDLLPEYRYRMRVESRLRPTRKDREYYYVEDNPFAMAIEQEIYSRSLKDDASVQKAIEIFEQLENKVTERWRGGFVQKYLEIMSQAASYSDREAGVTSKIIEAASKHAFDESLTDEQVETFATDYYEASLDPRNENVKVAFRFCELHADKINTWTLDERKADSDSTWYNFSLMASDLFRYPIYKGVDEEEQVSKAKNDLTYAIGAVSRIKDQKLRDRAIANLVYALTDEDIGDLDSAESFRDLVEDEVPLREIDDEIELEKRRRELNETTTWKKMERVRRKSGESVEFLRNLFGYGSAEGLKKAKEEYYAQFKHSPDYFVSFDPENATKFEDEVERIQDDFSVTLNITWNNVLQMLDQEKVASIWENPDEIMFLDDENENVETAKKVGLRAQLYESVEQLEI